jgi:hypothetical protein
MSLGYVCVLLVWVLCIVASFDVKWLLNWQVDGYSVGKKEGCVQITLSMGCEV